MTRALTPTAIVDAFERIASRIQERTACDRIAALQRAVDEHPIAFAQYLSAIQAGDSPEGLTLTN